MIKASLLRKQGAKPRASSLAVGSRGAKAREEASTGESSSNSTSGNSSIDVSLGRSGDGSGSGGSGPAVRGWSAQAATAIGGLDGDGGRSYKSIALQAEVRLAEALERCGSLAAPAATGDWDESCAGAADPDASGGGDAAPPNRLRTAVCCQLLAELADIAGPLSTVLTTLQREVVRSCYSGLHAPTFTTTCRPPHRTAQAQGGSPGALGVLLGGGTAVLGYDQLPWHSVAARLRRENGMLQEEQAAVRRQLEEHRLELEQVEQTLTVFKAAMEAAEAGSEALRAANAALALSESKAAADAAVAMAETQRLGAQLSRLQEDLAELRAANAALSEAGAATSEAWDRRLEAVRRELRTAEMERAAACELAAGRVAPEEADGLRVALEEAEAALLEARSQAATAEAREAAAAACLTPRPDWQRLALLNAATDGNGAESASTAARVEQLVTGHFREVRRLHRALGIAAARAAPDAGPADWRFEVSVEALPCFITEGVLSSGAGSVADTAAVGLPGAQQVLQSAAPLGTGPAVPRFLRREIAGAEDEGGGDCDCGRVELVPISLERLEAEILELWAARAGAPVLIHGAGLGSTAGSPLHSFLYEHLLSSTGGDAAARVAAGYSFYHALQREAAAAEAAGRPAAPAALLLRILTGRLPEPAFWEQQQLLRALRCVAGEMVQARPAAAAAAAAPPPSAAGASPEELAAALRFLLPFASPADIARLRGAVQGLVPRTAGCWDMEAVYEAAGARLLEASISLQQASNQEIQHTQQAEGASEAAVAARALVDELLAWQLVAIEARTAGVQSRLRTALLPLVHPSSAADEVLQGASMSPNIDKVWEDATRGASEGLEEGEEGGAASGEGRATATTAPGAGGASLLATAASMRLRHGQQGLASGGGASVASLPAAALQPPEWLRFAVARVGALPLEERQGAVTRLLAAVQGGVLLMPRCCTLDPAGALQWVRISFAAHQGGGGGPVTVQAVGAEGAGGMGEVQGSAASLGEPPQQQQSVEEY